MLLLISNYLLFPAFFNRQVRKERKETFIL